MTATNSVIIVGAGWAGLSAALTAAQHGKRVTLLEAAPQAGGRAREIPFGTDWVDNGQHLLLGAYTQTTQLLQGLGIPIDSVFHRTPLTLSMRNLKFPKKNVHLPLPTQLTPWRLLWNSLSIKGLSGFEKLRAIQFFYAMKVQEFRLPTDCSILSLLVQQNQPHSLITTLWEPIALAALSTPIQEASAQVFVNILHQVFFKGSFGAQALFPTVNLTQLLPKPILDYLHQGEHDIFYHHRVRNLIIEQGQCTGVLTDTGTFRGTAVILATPPQVSAHLLQAHPHAAQLCRSLIENLLQFRYQPITTVYLRYPHPVQLKTPMVGILHGTGHWVFDRSVVGQPTLLSVVITGNGPHSALTHAELIQTITQELAVLFPTLTTPPLNARVVVEKEPPFLARLALSITVPLNKPHYSISCLPATIRRPIIRPP